MTPRLILPVCALVLATAALAHGCPATKKRLQVLSADTQVEGITWPAGSTLIHRNGYGRSCNSTDDYCLSEVQLSRDLDVCGVPIPQAASVRILYENTDDKAYPELGRFLIVRGTERFTLDGVTLRFLANVRCDVQKGQLRGGQLDEAHTFGSETLPAGAWFTLYAPQFGGGLSEAWFRTAATFHQQAVRAGTIVRFAPDGTVTGYRAENSAKMTFSGVSCYIGDSTFAKVYPSGKLKSCELAKQQLGDLLLIGQTTFYESGAVATSTLAKAAVISGQQLAADTEIKLTEDGKLLPK